MKEKTDKKYFVGDIKSLQEEFYRNYPDGYWTYKICLLKNAYSDFDSAKAALTKNIEGCIDTDFRKMLRTEMHFLYFQLIEALFEMIFAITDADNRNMWVSLSFSNWKRNYERVRLYAERAINAPNFRRPIKIGKEGDEQEIPLLRWIFYFNYPLSLTNDQWNKNLDNIEALLHCFAKDFSDRGDYNAFKHSLRFYNSECSFAIGKTGAPEAHVIGASQDAITFLEEEIEKTPTGEEKRYINTTTKPFDFERDYRCAIAISALIQNMINTRKHSILENLHGESVELHKFDGISPAELCLPKTGLSRISIRN